ncbi:MAG: LCP family protein [Chloroflexi bacterium]|nr:LCP family protein [Chloroflexota bacterium]MBK6711830.1 LCP family protein [Chloroflexota bacterium]MBK8931652.1 LCP family protein [Chloroflexota bacterium]MBP7592067.1 LCP family protein [Chloroflexota bacterium]
MGRSNGMIPGWLAFALSTAFVFSGIAVIIFAYLTFQVIWSRPLNPIEQAAAEVADVDLQLEQVGPAVPPTLQIGMPTPTLFPTQEPWQGDDRINILLMGIDRRPGEAFVSRTDSIMIVSVDPATETVSILSIPRDLYVVIPGRGRDRINTAFVYGSSGNDPESGASLSMQTVAYNLGVPVDHYILVDFSAVTRGVDTLGGIDVYVPYDISDPTYPSMDYGYDPFYISAGTQHMDGETALKYARTRHADNDFGRANRQQQVILAARDKALSLGIGGLLSRAPSLYSQLENGIRTDLSLEQIISLAKTVSDIPSEQIRSEVLDYDYVSSYLTETGAQVLILDNEKATTLIRELFYNE